MNSYSQSVRWKKIYLKPTSNLYCKILIQKNHNESRSSRQKCAQIPSKNISNSNFRRKKTQTFLWWEFIEFFFLLAFSHKKRWDWKKLEGFSEIILAISRTFFYKTFVHALTTFENFLLFFASFFLVNCTYTYNSSFTTQNMKKMFNGKNALQPWPGRFSLLTAWPRFTLYWKHSVHFIVFIFFPQ